MGRTKGAVIAVLSTVLVIAFSFQAGSEEPRAKPQAYEYAGIIKAKGDGTHILKIETQSGPMNFHYQRHGKRQCAGFKELNVGDSVKVTASDNKTVAEATCILKVKPEGVSK